MNNTSNYYQLYINKVMELAETIVIKSTATATSINRFVTDYNGESAVNSLDPTTWKYYLNLSGEYHATDELMHLVSMDTLENIIFTKANLEIHRATKRGYAYGTRQYKELVSRYPLQETLILGILYPVDIDTAIAAPDGQILGYPPNLVEANEYGLVSRLQQWINGYKIRWTNNQYGISDDLYPATSLGIMYLNLVPAILNLRLEACKTNEAHSFHVRQYLAGHGMLDVYMDQLTLKQTLFFYRNIAYIERNTGQKNIFEWLVEHIMTERNLPLAEYVMRHDISAQPADVYPTLSFRKNPLNLGYVSDPLESLSLQQILDKENKLARDNFTYAVDNVDAIQSTMENSLSNVVLTKALESAMIDYSNNTPYTLEDTLMAHWLELSSKNLYTAFIGVTNPRTGERIPLTVKEAYVFMWYAFCASIDIVLDEIPEFYAKRVQRIPSPSMAEVMSVVDVKYLPQSVVQQAYDYQPIVEGLISTEAFYNKCVEINTANQKQRRLIAYQEHHVRRGMLQGAVAQLYSDNTRKLSNEGETYTEWFTSRNINIDVFDRADLELIYLNLVRDATGLSLTTTNSLKELQATMVRLLAQLSSYSVQFMTQINSDDIRIQDWAAIRVGDMHHKTSGVVKIPDLNVRVQSLIGRLKFLIKYDLGAAGLRTELNVKLSDRMQMEINIKPDWSMRGERRRVLMHSAPVTVTAQVPPVSGVPGLISVIGIEHYVALQPVEQATLRDVYRTYQPGASDGLTPLDEIVTAPVYDGFIYIPPAP